MAMFKTLHPENLNQLRALLALISPVWFHADGNMYHVEKESTDRKLFVNYNPEGTNHPANIGAKYRIKFFSASQVPATLDELEKLFLEAKQNEDVAASEPLERKGNFVFSVPAAEVEAPGRIAPLPEDKGKSEDTSKPVKVKQPTKAEQKAAELAALTSAGTDTGTGGTGSADDQQTT